MGENAVRRRRSKTSLSKLSGKRTVAGLDSGENALNGASPKGSPLRAKLSGISDRDKEGCLPFYVSVFYYMKLASSREDGVNARKTNTAV